MPLHTRLEEIEADSAAGLEYLEERGNFDGRTVERGDASYKTYITITRWAAAGRNLAVGHLVRPLQL